MFSAFRLLLLLLLIYLGGCATKGRSALSDALRKAVKEKKLSEKKVESIMKEYEMLRDKNQEISRKYVEGILNALEMGGDSSHVDVVRRLVAEEDGNAKV